MTYWDQSTLSTDADFRQRIAACIAQENLAPAGEHPTTTADKYQWDISAEGDLAASYASAVVSENPNPGRDPAVITDAALLAAVVAVVPAPA